MSATTVAAAPAGGSARTLRHVRYVLAGNPVTALAFGLFALLALGAVAGPWIAPYDPISAAGQALRPPSAAHWFGTDSLGRDVFSRVLAATRLDLGMAFRGGAGLRLRHA